ncbi:hypothetical protein BV22DRAFT_1127120 [Leucogyrophana mollusca]|uniref:Uncharacterized protein n=1 Tax=Leucogyrophana mollusca TaxID=85980 RepID=A0ACB8BQD1_9AGAM|nr:hypothetical protein BV22DRAFT_1127120 [Leucogyrophana mollusca]
MDQIVGVPLSEKQLVPEDDEHATPILPVAKQVEIDAPSVRGTIVCRYFRAGYCRRGSACQFGHPVGQGTEAPEVRKEASRSHAPVYFPRPFPSSGWHPSSPTWCPYGPPFPLPPPYSLPGIPLTRGAILQHTESDFVSAVSERSSSASSGLSERVTDSRLTEAPKSHHSAHAPYYIGASGGANISLPFAASEALRGIPVYSPYPAHVTTALYPQLQSRPQAADTRRKPMAYKTKPCRFFSAKGSCVNGEMCTFIHDLGDSSGTADSALSDVDSDSRPELPAKPTTVYEDSKAKDYYPITWRVVGGGVMMGGNRQMCKAYTGGYCKYGDDCKFAHETELETYPDGLVQLKSRRKQSSATQKALIAQALVEVSQTGAFRPSPVRRERKKKTGKHPPVSEATCEPGPHKNDPEVTEKAPTTLDEQGENVKEAGVETDVHVLPTSPAQHRRSRSMTIPSSPPAASNIFSAEL